jgi:hypothetical protein
MSYDLYFLPPEHAADSSAAQAFLDNEEEAAQRPSNDVRQSQLADALRQENPALEIAAMDYAAIAGFESTTVDAARAKHNHIELNTPEGGLRFQITLYPSSAAITIPYWYGGDEARALTSELERYAKILVLRGSYRIYDPQSDRVADNLEELRDDLLRHYGATIERIPEIVAKADLTSADGSKKPWWKFW